MVELTIGSAEAGKRLVRWMRQMLPGVPLSGIHMMIRKGRVKVNGRRGKPDMVLGEGDTVRLYMSAEEFSEVSRSPKKFAGVSTDLDVVHEDDDMIIVNKPAGLLVHGAPGEYKDTLANRVLAYLHHRGELPPLSAFTPGPVHRLDRNTSGLVVFAKHAEAARRLSSAMKDHTIRKGYATLVCGDCPPSGAIRAHLERDPAGVRTLVRDTGKAAETLYRTVMRSDHTSLVWVRLVSGRTHQIRAHFAHVGHPLVGDFKYGGPAALRPLRKGAGAAAHHWLHAGRLEFPDGRCFQAPLPSAFLALLRQLGYDLGEVQRRYEGPTAWP